MAQCTDPFMKDAVPCPCGSCPNCRARRVSNWSFRLMQQEKVSSSAHFLTLTYDTKFVPITKSGFLTLCKRDVQLFFKRYRASDTASAGVVKYYAVGEYGGNSRRPHYHVIAFGFDISKVESAWQLGSIHRGDVSAASIGYCLKYISKPKTVPRHRNDDRVPEFSLMSKGWG